MEHAAFFALGLIGTIAQVIKWLLHCRSSYKKSAGKIEAFASHAEDMLDFLRKANWKLSCRGALPTDAVLRINKFARSVLLLSSFGHIRRQSHSRVARLQKTMGALFRRGKIHRFLWHAAVSDHIDGLYKTLSRIMRDFGVR